MIFTLRNIIPQSGSGTQIATGQWVRAMHEPFRGGLLDRACDALAVLRGKDVFAFRWPAEGEYEQAVALADRELRQRD